MGHRFTSKEMKGRRPTPGGFKQLVVVDAGRDFTPRKKVFIFDPNGTGKSSQYEDDFYWAGTIRGLHYLSNEDVSITGTSYDSLLDLIRSHLGAV